MDLQFDGQAVLVTGGTRGIGRSIAVEFARRGARVAATYVSSKAQAAELEAAAAREGQTIKCYRADVRDAAAMAAVVDDVVATWGRLDVVVNNAGVTRDGLILAMEADDWDTVLATNLTGIFHVVKPAAKAMLRRRSGVIINISSIIGAKPGKGQANYAASKGGVEALTRALAAELGGKKIRVNCVAPGLIETEMSHDIRQVAGDQLLAQIPLKRYGQPLDVAQAVLFLASDQASYITGQTLHVNGGM